MNCETDDEVEEDDETTEEEEEEEIDVEVKLMGCKCGELLCCKCINPVYKTHKITNKILCVSCGC